jgi:molybdopterin molybdotransferase
MLQSAQMLTVAEAQSLVLEQAPSAAPVRLKLESCLGLVLAEDVASDIDMPPFDKALMDGYAVRAADFDNGKAVLKVIGEVTAGAVPATPVAAGEALRIMTGAPMPAGADTVVMIERTGNLDEGKVAIEDTALRGGQNVLARAREMKCGETILQRGVVIRPQEIGILAAAGRGQAAVFPRPRVAVVSTGDEVVEPCERPGPGQIRNSNGAMLTAQADRAGAVPQYLGIARDRLESLRPMISAGLDFDVLLLSGGVSAGKLDLVPSVLQELEVRPHFHKVAMKPGKPVFFGSRGRTMVFGLPGNPVSALVCFEIFVRPALRRVMGYTEALSQIVHARLEADFDHRSDRPTYRPAELRETSGGRVVRPVPWFGSSDLRALSAANAFMVLPAGQQRYHTNDLVPVMLVDS